jgi:hypothetical protein
MREEGHQGSCSHRHVACREGDLLVAPKAPPPRPGVVPPLVKPPGVAAGVLVPKAPKPLPSAGVVEEPRAPPKPVLAGCPLPPKPNAPAPPGLPSPPNPVEAPVLKPVDAEVVPKAPGVLNLPPRDVFRPHNMRTDHKPPDVPESWGGSGRRRAESPRGPKSGGSRLGRSAQPRRLLSEHTARGAPERLRRRRRTKACGSSPSHEQTF